MSVAATTDVRVRLGWALAALCLVCAAADTVITLVALPFFSEEAVAQHGWPFATAAALACGVMGALIVSRYPVHLIGWLLIGCGVSGSVSLVAEAWHLWVLHSDGPGSTATGHLVGWLSQLVGAPLAISFIALIFFTAPDGRLFSRRWRWGVAAAIGGVALYDIGLLTVPPGDVVVDESQDFGLLAGSLMFGGIILIALSLIASVVSLVRRMRRVGGIQRLQLRWIAVSAAAIAFGLAWLLVLQGIRGGEQNWLDSMPLFLSYLGLPIVIAIAMLRHQLFDIDLIINRAALVAIATAFVAGVYVVLVVVIGGNASGRWPTLVETAVVAMAFQPLRTRVVHLADRLAFGTRAVPYEALAEFSRRLGESPHPDALLPAVAESAAHAVNARRATARLFVDGEPVREASWPAGLPAGPGAPALQLPVADRGEPLGAITVEMPPGRALRDRDVRLVTDLADHASIAFRNARLAVELSARVDELNRRTLDLIESRRRLITAGDAERRRLERSIAREVTPHLARLPDELDRLATAQQPDRTGDLGRLVRSSVVALESLREITRGVFPAQLERGGLEPALTSLLGRPESRGRLDVHQSAANRRFDARVEATAYFCVVEATRDLGPPVDIALEAHGGQLVLQVSGSVRGPMPLAQVRDRVAAVEGAVLLELFGGSAALQVTLPITPADGAAEPLRLPSQSAAASQAAESRSGPNADFVT